MVSGFDSFRLRFFASATPRVKKSSVLLYRSTFHRVYTNKHPTRDVGVRTQTVDTKANAILPLS